jgi:hypothetical protein
MTYIHEEYHPLDEISLTWSRYTDKDGCALVSIEQAVSSTDLHVIC